MTQRRYGDEEVREILSLATMSDAQDPSLTLEDLQRIGQEVGIEPARVAEAAARLDARGSPVLVRRAAGLPIGVSQVVALPRAPTDREWEQLVTEFRSTFGTQGIISASGGLREWSRGNLHICVEPTQHGYQLRLSTLKGDARAFNALALVFTGVAVLMGTVIVAAGKPDQALAGVAMFGGMALLAFGSNVLRLPRWARQREQQMQTLAERAVKLLSNPQG
jgi:hypothetical protein